MLNLDDVSHIEFLSRTSTCRRRFVFATTRARCEQETPSSGNPRKPNTALRENQLLTGMHAKDTGRKRFGLHTMVASNERNVTSSAKRPRCSSSFASTCTRKLACELIS